MRERKKMPPIVYQIDKRSGITYAYESVSYCNKEKQQSRAKRKRIGRVDKETGEIILTDGRCRNKERSSASETVRYFYCATYLLDSIGNKLGIADDLKHCFPATYKQI